MINQKMKNLGQNASAIRELFEYGKRRKAEIGEDKVYDFSIGNPNVPSPSIVNETLINLIQNTDSVKLHGYTSAAGDIQVRKQIANYLNNKYNANTNENLIYLTVGAAGSLTITLNALLNQDDEVVVFTPYFPEYKVFVEKAGGILKCISSLKDSFKPDLEELEKAITTNTKAIIINYPNNPTGVVLNKEDVEKLSKLLLKKQEEYKHPIYIISDEPYRELVYDVEEMPYITNYYHNSIVCYSFSKSLSLPGERIGYIMMSEQMDQAKDVFAGICGSGRALGFVCAPSLFQYMIPACLGKTSDLEYYKHNRDLLSKALTSYGYEVVQPDGAFYLFVKALNKDATKFSEYAKKYELLIVPSDSFGCSGYVRISYCVSTKQIKDALPLFKQLFEDYKQEVKDE